jgi:L-malate glycosyltransferase
VTPWFTASGGVATFAQQLHEQLNRTGASTYTWICGERPSAEERLSPGVSYIEIPAYVFHRLNIKFLLAQIFRSPVILARIIRSLREHNVKTVILIFPIEYAWPFVLLRRLLGFSLIVSCHGSEVRGFERFSFLLRTLFTLTLKAADAITACSEDLARELRRICPQNANSIRVVPNSVDVEHFTVPPGNLRKSGHIRTLVHVSNFSNAKRVEDIIEAFAIADIPSTTRLIMVGDGPNRGLAISRARSLGIESRVDFVGYQRDVRPFFWQADVFVMASEIESDPLALLEAMACGLPWIATPFGAVTSIPENECGVVVPAKCPDQLAKAMAELLNDHDRCRLMGMRGRQRAERDLDAKQNAKLYLELIHEAVE